MRGVRYVTYAFIAIISLTIIVCIWLAQYENHRARKHTDTFLRVLGSCSIILTFVFYYNLIKSYDDARRRGEEQDDDHELDRRGTVRKELTDLFKDIPYSVLSVVELNPRKKYSFADEALKDGELSRGLTEYRLKSVIFDMWLSDINLFVHRSPTMINRVATMITQAISPVLRVAWNMYSYQYSSPMIDFVNAMYRVIDKHMLDVSSDTPMYQLLAIEVLEVTNHIKVSWTTRPRFYTFNKVQYVLDQEKYIF